MSSPDRRVWVYLPYVDERAAGLQRYASQMILALQRAGLRFELIVGELHGRPDWLGQVPHRVILDAPIFARLPRSVSATLRLLRLQTMFLRARVGGGTLLALGHEALARPPMGQVAVAHDLTHLKTFSKHEPLSKRIRNRLWKSALERSRSIIAISHATRRDLIEVFGLDPDRIEVVYEGVDRGLFRPLVEEPANAAMVPYLLYAGTLQPHKNVGLLIEAYVRLRRDVEACDLKLAGNYTAEQVDALVAKIPAALRGDVHFVGFVSDEALAGLMRHCAGFVFPSRNEGFGLAPVEAMACGAPVLAADAGSLTEVIGDGGVLLSPDDVDVWHAEMLRLVREPDRRRALSERALRRSDIFSWDDAALSYIRLLENAAG